MNRDEATGPRGPKIVDSLSGWIGEDEIHATLSPLESISWAEVSASVVFPEPGGPTSTESTALSG